MKTCLVSLALLFLAPIAGRSQDVATSFSSTIEHHDTAGSLHHDELSEPLSARAAAEVPSDDRRPTLAITPGAHPEAVAAHATASLNGVNLQMQTLPASGTVLISFDMPSQQTLGTLELADAATGQLIYSGSVVVREGQVEIPVPDVRNLFEARLATDHDLLIARMMR